MKRPKVLIIGVATLVLAVCMVAWYEQSASYQWERFEAPDGKFTVNLPGKPVVRDELTTSLTGGSFTSHSVNAKASEHAAYGCSWWENPDLIGRSADQRLGSLRDKATVSEKHMTIQGYPAMEVQAGGDEKPAFDNRIVVVGPRIYSLVVVDTSGKHDRKNVKKFFDSFTLK
jgi:hypothetical protein